MALNKLESLLASKNPLAAKPACIAELSGNHNQDLKEAKDLICLAAKAGADAVKLQTFTPDTLTLPVYTPYFQVKGGLWKDRYLYDLYKKTMTPWDWHKPLADYAQSLGLTLFSTPFDESSVDFLEDTINPPLYKIATVELNHIPLLKHLGKTQKPVFLSTGLATRKEIAEAIDALSSSGCPRIILMKCISAYPATAESFNLNSIQSLAREFKCTTGLSDHSLDPEIALGAVALGARVIERHFTRSRKQGGPDSPFSTEPHEFKSLTESVKTLHTALGSTGLGPSKQELAIEQLSFRRSIFVASPIKAGERLSTENIRVVRPAYGLPPKHWETVLGKTASVDLAVGTPLELKHIQENSPVLA